MKLLVLLSFFTFNNTLPYFYIQPELEEVVMEVIGELEAAGIWPGYSYSFIIRTSSGVPRGREIAVAYGTNNDKAVSIMVYKERYDKLTLNQKKYVILHEIGHDVYNLKHTRMISAMSKEVPDYMPDSYIRHSIKDFIKMVKKKNKKKVGKSK